MLIRFKKDFKIPFKGFQIGIYPDRTVGNKAIIKNEWFPGSLYASVLPVDAF
jgi:hypothetical protein